MKYEFTKESKQTLDKLEEQGNDITNIPVIVESWKLDFGQLIAIIRPGIYSKDNYQLKANKDCGICRGKGWLRYQLDQDDIKSAPCHICFPETASKSEWLRRATS